LGDSPPTAALVALERAAAESLRSTFFSSRPLLFLDLPPFSVPHLLPYNYADLLPTTHSGFREEFNSDILEAFLQDLSQWFPNNIALSVLNAWEDNLGQSFNRLVQLGFSGAPR